MVIVGIQVQNKLGKARFFLQNLSGTDTNMEVILRISFITLNNVNIGFLDKELTQRTYSVAKAVFTTKKIQIIDWKEFAQVMLDFDKKTFVIYIATITSEITIYPEHKAQITFLKTKKALISVPAKYLDFANIFSKELTIVLPKHTKISTHAIDLEEDKQPPYGSIYNLSPVKLETYKTNLANSFICSSKISANAPILFDQKLDRSL